MTDLENAICNLDGHSLCLCKGDIVNTYDERGIVPMMKLISQGTELTGFSAADRIVGRAAAMLFVKAGVVNVYGKVMSDGAKEYLENHGISCSYDTLTEKIINRQGNDICPMEKAVMHIENENEGYNVLLVKMRGI